MFKVSSVQGQQCSRSAVFKVTSVQCEQCSRSAVFKDSSVQGPAVFKVSSVQKKGEGELTCAAGGQQPSCRQGCPRTRPGPGQTAAPSTEPATHAAQHQILVAARLCFIPYSLGCGARCDSIGCYRRHHTTRHCWMELSSMKKYNGL